MVQPSRSGLGSMGRRRYQLMINDAPRSSKVWLTNIINSLDQRSASPIIHELEEELLDEAANNDEEIISDFPHVTSPVQDDESNGDINNGRKSTDYVVDHADDYELGDMPQNGIGRKRAYSGGEDLYKGGAPKVVRQQPGATSVHDTQQMPMGTQQVKVEKDMYGGKGTFIPQKSLLKGAGGNKKVIKQEKEHFGKYEMSVPDNSVAVPLQTSTSPSSSTGSGKSFYSKDDLFSDEVPNELFGEDANTLLINDETPLLTSGGVDSTPCINYDPNVPIVVIPGATEGPSTSNTVVIADGSNMQVAKFNGKSNATDLTKLSSHSEYDSHLNDVQTDLDVLKDILRGDNYQFDTSALLNVTGDPSNYNRYFMPSQMDPATIQKLFNSEDGIGSYDMPALTDATGAPSPDTNVGISEYAPDVDLSELLQMPANGDFEENNQQSLTSTRT